MALCLQVRAEREVGWILPPPEFREQALRQQVYVVRLPQAAGSAAAHQMQVPTEALAVVVRAPFMAMAAMVANTLLIMRH